jgi:hypothetical protein
MVVTIVQYWGLQQGSPRVVLALGVGLEHLCLSLLGHVDLPALVDPYASLIPRVEHGGVDDVHFHILVLGVGLERPRLLLSMMTSMMSPVTALIPGFS